MIIDASVGKRISMLRTLLILFIVFLHTGETELAVLNYNHPVEVIRFLFQDILGRLGVPTLTVISGYLLFSAKLDMTPLKMYKKKFDTLVIPFLFFNVLYFAVQYGVEYLTGFSVLYTLTDKSWARVINYATSYNGTPLNEALHFLRDMAVLVVLAPLFGFFLRRCAIIGLVLVSVFFLNNFDHTLVNRNTMAVLFYVGGWVATAKFDLKKFDHLAKYSLMLLVAVCFATMYFKVTDYTYIYLTAPFAVWPAAVLLVDTKVGAWLISKCKYSFFLFLVHTPIIRILELLNNKFFSGKPTFLFSVVSLIIVVIVAFNFYNLAVKYIPNVFCFLIGGRSEKKSVKVNAIVSHAPLLNKHN